MGRKEAITVVTVNEALSVLRNLQSQIGHSRSRYHDGAMEDNMRRMRAIGERGICGSCDNIHPEVSLKHGKKRISLRCRANNSPLELYRQTLLGETPNCPDRHPKITY
mgnify:CR=1 FL=1